jgi:hypothetical protein
MPLMATDFAATGSGAPFLTVTGDFAGGMLFAGTEAFAAAFDGAGTALAGADLAGAALLATGAFALPEDLDTVLLFTAALAGAAAFFTGAAAFFDGALTGSTFFATLLTGFTAAFFAGVFLTGWDAFLAVLAAFLVAMLRSFFGNDYF